MHKRRKKVSRTIRKYDSYDPYSTLRKPVPRPGFAFGFSKYSKQDRQEEKREIQEQLEEVEDVNS